MKIAFLTEYSDIGGGESNLFLLSKTLNIENDVTVFCPEGQLFNLLAANNIKVKKINLLGNRRWIGFFPLISFSSFWRILNEFDIIHCYSVNTLPLVFNLAKPIIWTTHGYWERPFGLKAKIINHFITKVIAVSKDVFNISDFPLEKKTLIYLGANIANENLIITKTNFDPLNIVISVIGRFQRIKGHNLVLDALHKVSTHSNINIILYIIGDVNGKNHDDIAYKNEILRKISVYHSNKFNIKFEGFKKNVNEYIAKSDFIIVASLYESFSMVTIEALALGKPVVAPNVGGPSEIINSTHIGRLFNAGDYESLYINVIDAITHFDTFDADACRERAKFFSINNQVNNHLNLYNKICHNSSKLSILFITSRADFGGGPAHLLDLIRGIENKFRIYIACPFEHPFYFEFAKYAECIQIPHRKFSFNKIFKLFLLLKSKKINLIHSHGRGAGFYSRILGIICGIKVIHTFHGFPNKKKFNLKYFIYVLSEIIFSFFTIGFINVSKSENITCIKQKVIRGSKYAIIENGVCVPSYRPRIFNTRKVRIINVSRLESEKGIELLLDLAYKLRLRFNYFELLIVGDGSQRNILDKRVKQLKLDDHVSFLGYRDDVPSLLQSSDIYISTSKGEGLPISILEAMANSLLVIASDVNGNSDLITHMHNGILFNLNSLDDVIDIIIKVLKGELDVDKMRALSYALVKESYTKQLMCNKTLEFYKSILTI